MTSDDGPGGTLYVWPFDESGDGPRVLLSRPGDLRAAHTALAESAVLSWAKRGMSPPDTMDVLREWVTFLSSSYAPATERTYRNAVFGFFREVLVPVSTVRQGDVAAWLARFPYRSSARRTYYQALRSFFSYCVRQGVLLVDPLEGLRVPAAIEKVPTALTEEQVQRLAVAGAARHPLRGLAILLLYYTGARLSEATGLRWSDIRGDMLRIAQAKGGRERWLPLSPACKSTLAHMREFTGDGEYVIGRTPQTLWKWVRDAGYDAGIPEAHPHELRSTFATVMLVRGAKPHTVRELLGHRNIRTTMRYWATTDSDRREAVALL